MSSVTGDFREFRELISRLANPKPLINDATRAAGSEVTEQYQGDFSGSHDPWGGAWKPRKDGKGGGRPLYQSGNLANPQIVASNGVIKVRPERYWVFHQVGANNMFTRGILPFSASAWDPPIERALDEVVVSYFYKA